MIVVQLNSYKTTVENNQKGKTFMAVLNRDALQCVYQQVCEYLIVGVKDNSSHMETVLTQLKTNSLLDCTQHCL